MKVETKAHESNKLLNNLINMHKPHKDKFGIGFQIGECSNQKDKDRG